MNGEKLMPTTFDRSLLRQGLRGVVVTIPAGWMTIHYLKAGDRVQLELNHLLRIRAYRGGRGKPNTVVRTIGKKTGQHSYRVAVPPAWLRQHGLGPGDRVQLQVGDELTISHIPLVRLREEASDG